MHDSTFKNMRRYGIISNIIYIFACNVVDDIIHRFLPKNGQKMNWRSSVHAVVADMASK